MTRKEDIIHASAKLFRRKGFSSSSMRDIAASVGIEAPSLYNHIKSKHEILSILLIEVAEKFTTGMDEIIKSKLPADETLKQLINLHVHLTLTKTDQIALITHEWNFLEGDAREKFIRLRKNYEDNFRRILEAGTHQNIFKQINVDLILFSILSTLRWLYAWYSANPHQSEEQIEANLYSLLIEGIIEKR